MASLWLGLLGCFPDFDGLSGGPAVTTGSGSTGSGGTGGSGGAEIPSNLQIETKIDSEWETGRCSTTTVTNTGTEAVIWEVTLDLGGPLTSFWNATVEQIGPGTKVRFAGEAFNRTLETHEKTSFGYCVGK